MVPSVGQPERLCRAAGNRATAGLLARPGTAAFLASALDALHAAGGNRRLARLLEPGSQPEAGPDSRLGDLETVGAGMINELAIVHDLRRAIDDRVSPDNDLSNLKRKVKYEIVERALTGLAPSQAKTVQELYAKEAGRELQTDLFSEGVGEGIGKSSLNDAQRVRLKALLMGTALESAGGTARQAEGLHGSTADPTGGPGAFAIAHNRAKAEAAELKLLIDTHDEPSLKRIMITLRKNKAANDMIATVFEQEFDKNLDDKLDGLPGRKGDRALALRHGNHERADAIALADIRERIKAFEAGGFVKLGTPNLKKIKEERDKLVGEVEEVLSSITEEAAAAGGSADEAKAAVAQHLAEVLAIKVDEDDEESIGDMLKKTLGATDASVLDALATGDPVEAAVAKLARADIRAGAGGKLVAETLRGLHDRAEKDVDQDIRAKAIELRKQGMAPDQLVAAVEALSANAREQKDERATSYIARLKTRIDELGSAGEAHHRFSQIVESLDGDDKTLATDLANQGGKVAALEELNIAMRAPDLGVALKVLRGVPPAERRSLVLAYNAQPYNAATGTTLAREVAGKAIEVPEAWGKNVHLPRTDEEAAIAELIEAPDPGGESELNWSHKWVRDTYERALADGGITGELADIGGRKVRTMLDDSVDATTDAIGLYKSATSGEGRAEALRQLHNARSAITGDKSAYIADTDAVRASIANAVAMVIDVALTIMLPETAGLASKLAASLVANIGSKVVVLQDQYSFDQLKGDLVGAVVGLGLGSPSKLAGEEAAKLVGRKIASTAESIGWKVSPELKGLAPSLSKLGGEVGENLGTTMATNVALGKDATEDLGSATVTGIVKGKVTTGLKGVVHGPAGGQGGESTEHGPSGGEEAMAGPQAKLAAGETTAGNEGGGGGGGGRGGGDSPAQTHNGTGSEQGTATDESAITDGEPAERTPMALEESATESPAGGLTDGQELPGAPQGQSTIPKPGSPEVTSVPEDAETAAGPDSAQPPKVAAKDAGTAQGGDDSARGTAEDKRPPVANLEEEGPVHQYGQTPRATEADARPSLEGPTGQAAKFVPAGGGEPTLDEPTVETLDETAYSEVAPPAEVGGAKPSNELVFLRLGEEISMFKPKKGETNLKFGPDQGIHEGERYRRSKGAETVLKALGIDTPDVRLVRYKGELGSLQTYREGYATGKQLREGGSPLYEEFWNSDERRALDTADFLLANQDRHDANWMLKPDAAGEPHMIAIDNDSSLPAESKRGYRPQESEHIRDRPGGRENWVRDLPPAIDQKLADNIRKLAAEFPETVLRESLTQPEVEGLRVRLSVVIVKLDNGQIRVR